MSSVQSKRWARARSALRTGSLAYKVGTIVEGGCVSNVKMSDAACLRKSLSFTSGNDVE